MHGAKQPKGAKEPQQAQVPPEVLKFISENQKMAGFSGHISRETASYKPDMSQISNSAKRFGAQVPSAQTYKPRLTKFGSHPI
jgi:hypothetical protein